MTNFPAKLKQLRIEHGYTVQQASELIGLSKNAISNYEQGIREPSLNVLKAICKLYNVSSDYLIGLSDF